eukprot:TRINITY_DN2667_c0_g1_i11.p1 TRINITY_DN2667_c0_g1~~TRINITY_DN2667_c0_g1_i11.p1  ORF type:complete len:171 (-),score=33.37 TRINITY_DN2667_c0_g1_i11:171-683(-)
MIRISLSIIFLGFAFGEAGPGTRAIQQRIECFDQPGGEGLSEVFTDSITDLSKYSFDEKISSCCATGTWILYADADFNTEDAGAASYWIYGDGTCLDVPDLFNNQASSLRYAGSRADWCFDSLNLYYGPYFNGYESEWIFKDTPDIGSVSAQSLIVSGGSSWTLYEGTRN